MQDLDYWVLNDVIWVKTKLVYYEVINDLNFAIARERQIKGCLRKKKSALIESVNPEWKDLSTGEGMVP